jgi:succinoglycan biosynthesis protein ExoL
MAAGESACALYFERAYFKGGEIPCKSQSIGYIEHGKYIKRLYRLMRAWLTISRKAKKSDILYAFGFDMGVLAVLASRGTSTKIVYEIGDVREIQLARTINGSLIRFFEKIIAKRADEIVVTASGFATEYYDKILGVNSNSIRVIENRVDLPPATRPEPPFYNQSSPIVIGYFGLLRCKKSWATLKALARKGGKNIKIVVRGYPMGIPVQEESAFYPNIDFGGPYVAPDDLISIYSNVDLVWGCYSFNNADAGNWKWARTNRFYESCFFRRPIISQYGTDEGYEVESYNIGTTLDLSNPENAAEQLLNCLPHNLLLWQKNAATLSNSMCMYTNEHNHLVESLRK